MVGITSEKIKSKGSLNTDLHINRLSIPTEFHIVDRNFPIATDGILGQNFLEFYECLINYKDYSLKINFGYGSTVTTLQNPKILNVITIPPRSEIYTELPIKLTEDSVVINKEVAKGIFIASSIIDKDTPVVKLMNINNKPVVLKNINCKYEPLSSFEIPKINKGISKNGKSEKLIYLEKLLIENNPHIKCTIKDKFLKLLCEYSDVFALENEKLSTNNFYKQKLRVQDDIPIYVKNYRLPHSQKVEINDQIKKLVENEIIEPSISEYSSPIFLVPKKSDSKTPDKKWRLVVDFRKLNKKLIGDVFPIPRIDDILDQLGRAKYFSVLDLQSGFHQIELDKNSRDYTSFQTDKGSFRFTRVPFGLKVAPNSFARMMSLAFAGLTPEKAFLYMDDLIVIGCSESHHLANLQSIFENCRKHNLKLNPKKCNFFRHEVTYLGHKCNKDGVSIDDSQVEVVQKYPIPTNADETKRFVAFANYYRKFIKNFALITHPLNKLSRKNIIFVWTEECQKAFEKIKSSLTSTPVLAYPDFIREFVIITDASKIGVGGTLCQEYDGILKPISYFSRSFTQGESNKATIEQELLGIYFSIMHFRPYIFGNKFKIKTDHKPLIYLFSLKNPSSRLTRIRLELEEYDFEIEHIPGKNNFVSDALSRIKIDDLKDNKTQNAKMYAITRSMIKDNNNGTKDMIHTHYKKVKPKFIFTSDNISYYNTIKLMTITFKNEIKILLILKNNIKIVVHEQNLSRNTAFELDRMLNRLNYILKQKNVDEIKMYDNDALLKIIELSKLKNAVEKILLKNKCLIVARAPIIIKKENEIDEIIKKYHDDPISGGHCGMKRTLAKVRSGYYFRNMFKKLKKYIKNCEKCKINKPGKATKENMIITETPNAAFDMIQIDTVGPIGTTSNGNKYILSIQCELTKYIILTPMLDKSAVSVARVLYNDVILKYGPPKSIKTDQGTEFLNQVVKSLCELLNIDHKISTPYHHQTLGIIERNHRELNIFLRNYLDLEKNDWDNWLQVYAFAYNTTPSYYHSYTPFELLFGRKTNLVEKFLVDKITPIYNPDDYSNLIKYQLEISLKKARNIIDNEKLKRKICYDKNNNSSINVNVGDTIYLKNENRSKLDKFYNGPFIVTELMNNNNIRIKNNSKETIVHKNNVILR